MQIAKGVEDEADEVNSGAEGLNVDEAGVEGGI